METVTVGLYVTDAEPSTPVAVPRVAGLARLTAVSAVVGTKTTVPVVAVDVPLYAVAFALAMDRPPLAVKSVAETVTVQVPAARPRASVTVVAPRAALTEVPR